MRERFEKDFFKTNIFYTEKYVENFVRILQTF